MQRSNEPSLSEMPYPRVTRIWLSNNPNNDRVIEGEKDGEVTASTSLRIDVGRESAGAMSTGAPLSAVPLARSNQARRAA